MSCAARAVRNGQTIHTHIHTYKKLVICRQKNLRYLQQNGDIFFPRNINAWCDRKKETVFTLSTDSFPTPLYKITKLSTSGAHWIIHLLLCLSLPFVQTFLSLLPECLNENGRAHTLLLRCPCFPGFAFVPRTPHFRKASIEGRFLLVKSIFKFEKSLAVSSFKKKRENRRGRGGECF